MKQLSALLMVVVCAHSLSAQENQIPASYSNLQYDSNGRLYFKQDEKKFYADTTGPKYMISQLLGNPAGTENGLMLDFGDLKGSVTYGLIPYGQSPHPLPTFRSTKTLADGKVEINIKESFNPNYDFVGWKETGKFTLGYRLSDDKGMIVFDGEVSVTGTGPFEVAPTIYEGPFVSNIESTSAVVWFETTSPLKTSVEVDGKKFEDKINNGASGAPYYAQERLPWSDHTKSFSVENAVCLFYVDGREVTMKVINPDTLNEIDELALR